MYMDEFARACNDIVSPRVPVPVLVIFQKTHHFDEICDP